MKILVVECNRHDRETSIRYLQAAGHEVTHAEDTPGGIAAFERARPEVVVLEGGMPSGGTVAFLQRLRRNANLTRPYVIVASAKPSATEIASVIAAGADDYMRKPLVREELEMRVGALDRIRTWAAQVFGLVHADGGSEGTTLIAKLDAWQSVDLSIMRDVAGLMGQSLAPDADENCAPCELGMSAQMPLTLATEQLEVRLTVAVDASSMRKVSEICLGDPNAPADALRDMVRELANTAGGAFLRAAESEGVELTCGLPTDTSSEGPRSGVSARQHFVLVSRDGGIRIAFDLEIFSKTLRRVNVAQLTEGMVLARDLYSVTGALLVPGGTRFTATLIQRLNGFVSPHIAFDIADAA